MLAIILPTPSQYAARKPMPKRKIIPLLEKLCLENVVTNMKRLWVRVYLMKLLDPTSRHHDTITGPFSMLAGSLLQDLLEIMRERRLLTPSILHILLLPQLKSLNLNYCSYYVDNTLVQTITVRCKEEWSAESATE
ncbi:uncharacterized protein LOC100552755 isoform X4 [Anolis carolinensis]|uniref:uncharacterized protein LOC100552755 isoform X4 n=1 Tax=Anolis carolinensis TaxID=28377 RepID=UPI002F2B5888